MKKLLVLAAVLIGTITLRAQETFFPTKEGTVLIYKTFDKKEKLTSMVKYTIKNVKINGSDYDITYQCESLDPKEKLVFKEDITIHQKGDKLYFDMSNFVNKSAFQQNGEMPANVEITGNNMEIPLNPKAGDLLPDANVMMSLKMGFVNMKMSADIVNRKVEDVEDVTVTAGTFKSYRFSSLVNASVLGIKTSSKMIEWYAKGVGTIKSESYDKKGDLQSRTELVEIH